MCKSSALTVIEDKLRKEVFTDVTINEDKWYKSHFLWTDGPLIQSGICWLDFIEVDNIYVELFSSYHVDKSTSGVKLCMLTSQ